MSRTPTRRVAGLPLVARLALLGFGLVVVGYLLIGNTGRPPVAPRRVKAEIPNLMMAAEEYHREFAAYPPGGTDLNDDGDLDDPGEDFGSGKPPTDPAHPTIFELQLRALCARLPIENGTRTVGPYYSLRDGARIVNGALVDDYGFHYRYLADGQRTTIDPNTGFRLRGRVAKREPVIWSVGPDGRQDPGNNNLDDDGDGKVDETDELVDDICSWN